MPESQTTDIGMTQQTHGNNVEIQALQDPDLTQEQRQLIQQIQGVRHVVINGRHGGFGLSTEAVLRYLEIKGISCWVEPSKKFGSIMPPTYWLVSPEHRVEEEVDSERWYRMTQAERQRYNQLYSQQVFQDRDLDRDDPVLVQVVRELGHKASGRHAELKIVEIPADVEWDIDEYDGQEWVAEKHRTWS
jgi:hypothetical protein